MVLTCKWFLPTVQGSISGQESRPRRVKNASAVLFLNSSPSDGSVHQMWAYFRILKIELESSKTCPSPQQTLSSSLSCSIRACKRLQCSVLLTGTETLVSNLPWDTFHSEIRPNSWLPHHCFSGSSCLYPLPPQPNCLQPEAWYAAASGTSLASHLCPSHYLDAAGPSLFPQRAAIDDDNEVSWADGFGVALSEEPSLMSWSYDKCKAPASGSQHPPELHFQMMHTAPPEPSSPAPGSVTRPVVLSAWPSSPHQTLVSNTNFGKASLWPSKWKTF